MHSERDYLVRFVFPELRERCLQRGIQLIDVDLRWGVTQEEAEMGKALGVCLDEIENCRPFFIGILGERYGWTPDNYQVPDHPQFDWLKTVESGYSITALEILHGVLRNPKMNENAFFFFRDPEFISAVPAEKRPEISAENPEAALKLKDLKKTITDMYGDGPHLMDPYPCEYAGLRFDATTFKPNTSPEESNHLEMLKKHLSDDWILSADAFQTLPPDVQQTALRLGVVYLNGLESFGKKVRDVLWNAIENVYPESLESESPLESEIRLHQVFSVHKATRLSGREAIITDILHKLTVTNRPLLFHGETGCGKSAIISELGRLVPKNALLIQRYCGITKNSTDLIALLDGVLAQLCEAMQIPLHHSNDGSIIELTDKLESVLHQTDPQNPIYIFIDGVEQLSEAHFAHYLQWVPTRLPPNVKLIISTNARTCKEHAANREIIIIGVPSLSDDESKRIVEEYLWKFRKKLGFDSQASAHQMDMLLQKKMSHNPFFLSIACEEIRIFPRFEDVSNRIQLFPDSIHGLIEQVLERLETDHGREITSKALSLIATSLHGLQEHELLQLLKREHEPILPQGIWAGLKRSLGGLLSNPFSEEHALYLFNQKIVAEVIQKRYLSGHDFKVPAYQLLADFGLQEFYQENHPLVNTGKFCAVYLLMAGMHDMLKKVLYSLGKCEEHYFESRSPVLRELLDHVMSKDPWHSEHPLVLLFDDLSWVHDKNPISLLLERADYFQHNESGLWSKWLYEKLSGRLTNLGKKKSPDSVWYQHKRAAILNNLYIYLSRNNQEKQAEKNLLESIKIREAIKDIDSDMKEEGNSSLMGNYLNLANLYMKQGLLDRALPHLEAGNVFFRGKITDKLNHLFELDALLKIRGSLILIYHEQGKTGAIDHLFEDTESLLNLMPDAIKTDFRILEGYGTLLNNYASYHYGIDSASAEPVLKKAVETFSQLMKIRPDNHRYTEALCTLKSNLAQIYLSKSKTDEAIELLSDVFLITQKKYRRNPDSIRFVANHAKSCMQLNSTLSIQEYAKKKASLSMRAFHLTKKLLASQPNHDEYTSWMVLLSENLAHYFNQWESTFHRVVEMTRLRTECSLEPFWLFQYIDLITDDSSTYSDKDFDLARSVVEANNDSFTAHFTLATMYLSEDLIKQAFVSMQKATQLTPEADLHPNLKKLIEQNDPETLRDMLFSQVSDALQNEEDDDDEEDDDEDFDEDPEFGDLYDRILKTWDDEEYESSLKLIEEYLENDPTNCEILSLYAYLLHYFDRIDEAIEQIMLILSINPDSADEWRLLGDIRMQKGDPKGAIKAYSKASESEPDDPDISLRLVKVYFETGDFETCLIMANKILQEEPDHTEALLYKGTSCYELADAQGTVATLLPLYEKGDCTPLALYCLADALIDLDKLNESIEVFRKIPKDDPNYVPGLNTTAYVLKKLGRFDEAIATADECIQIDPTYANAYFQKGHAQMELKQYSEAKKSIKMAKKLGNPNAEELLAEIKSLSGWFG